MKKFGIIVIALALVVVGMAMAEPGIPPVREVQGLTITSTIVGTGNFNQASSVRIDIAKGNASLTEVPPLADGCSATRDGVMYQSVYTEDSQNTGVGYITADKDLDVSTGAKILGEDNIKAVKQYTYIGADASSLITNDYMMIDGAGEDYGFIGENTICPFGSMTSEAPTFCNVVETGSNMNLKIANLNTQMADRFIMKSADPGVAISNSVGVSSYAADVPSSGSVTAWIRGSIKEGGRDTVTVYPAYAIDNLFPDYLFDQYAGLYYDGTPIYGKMEESANDLYMTMVFSDSTSMSGSINSFAKGMSYKSSLA